MGRYHLRGHFSYALLDESYGKQVFLILYLLSIVF
jgi:hypothetical protein